jgi:hypothetical protein
MARRRVRASDQQAPELATQLYLSWAALQTQSPHA